MARQKMLERTCKKCGHVWVIPKNLKNPGQMGVLGGMLSGNYPATNTEGWIEIPG